MKGTVDYQQKDDEKFNQKLEQESEQTLIQANTSSSHQQSVRNNLNERENSPMNLN